MFRLFEYRLSPFLGSSIILVMLPLYHCSVRIRNISYMIFSQRKLNLLGLQAVQWTIVQIDKMVVTKHLMDYQKVGSYIESA